jgi:hypothetical protein
LNGYLASHLADPALLRGDKFEDFMADRQRRLLCLIEEAMGKKAYTGTVAEEGTDAAGDLDEIEAALTIRTSLPRA